MTGWSEVGWERRAETSALLFPAFHLSGLDLPFLRTTFTYSQLIIGANYTHRTPLQGHLAWGKPGRA